MDNFKSLPAYIKKKIFTPKLVVPKKPSKPPTKLPTPKLKAPKRPSKPPTKMPTPKLFAPKKPSKPPTKLPTFKLHAPKKPSKPPTKKYSPKVVKVTSPKKISSPKVAKITSPKKVTSPKVAKVTSHKKVTSPKVAKIASKKISPKAKVGSKKISPKAKVGSKKISPKVKVGSKKSPTKTKEIDWPVLDVEEIKMLQKYTIMNPREAWGKKIQQFKDPAYVEKVAPKFKAVLDILQKDILPSSRKPIVGKALVFIRNKKDGLEALATYLTNVGKMTLVRGSDKTSHIKPGDNLLVMGEFGESSPLYSYGATSLKAAKNIVSKFNESDNAYGNKYPVMLVHERYMEGLDLNGVTHIILVQEPATPGMFDQIIGRGVRNCSHSKFPSSLWKVNIISLVNTYKRPTPDQVLEHNRERVTKLVDKVLQTSQEYSLDCGVSQKRYGHSCK